MSVIGFIAKILEKCIQKQLLFYLEQHDFITVDQSAYLKRHSTLSVLHKVTDNWLQAIDDNLINGVCFFDLTKCFNTIDPDILLFKLEKYGIKNKAHSWFKSYLYDHTQCSLVNGNLSNCANVRIGVPQGTVLGPILFLLFMNDLPMHVENVTLFADDTMIDVRGNTVDEVIILLQAEIDKLVNWFYMNKLTVNVKKPCSMLIGTPQKINNHYKKDSLGLIISGEILCNKSSYTYLGLVIDSCMTWDYAVSNTCKKIGTRISVMQKLSNVIPNIHANMLYYAFIQPYFDYGLTVWGNTSVINIDKLQRLQKQNSSCHVQ